MPGKRTQIRSGAGACAGGFGDLPFADNTFDLVISRNVTHIIRNHLKVYGNGSES